jgi:hypothetical protein
MPSNRPNLILDEQAFQDLLSAAYTIQEHGDLLKQVRAAGTAVSMSSAKANACNASGPRCGN